jgi:serine/threonine-protein kinase RsbW
MATIEIEIPPRSAYVGVARLALSSLTRYAQLDDDVAEDLKTAVSEACANAVIATGKAGTAEPVMISWTEEPTRVVIEVADRGAAGYESDHSSIETGESVDRVGLSIALLESLVDECEISEREGGGTCTRLVINR